MEYKHRKHLSQLIKYLKISHNLNQYGIADIAGCKKSKISNVENERGSFTLDEYVRIIEHFKVEGNPIVDGRFSVKNDHDPYTFKIPHKLGKHLHSMGASISLYRDYFIYRYGEQTFNDICWHFGYHPLYFSNAHNPVQLGFIIELLKYMQGRGHFTTLKEIKSFAFYAIYVQNGYISQKRESQPSFSVTKKVIESIRDIEFNHEYQILDLAQDGSFIELRYRPHPDGEYAKIWISQANVGYFLENCLGQILGQISGYTDICLDYPERITRGDPFTLCRLQAI